MRNFTSGTPKKWTVFFCKAIFSPVRKISETKTNVFDRPKEEGVLLIIWSENCKDWAELSLNNWVLCALRYHDTIFHPHLPRLGGCTTLALQVTHPCCKGRRITRREIKFSLLLEVYLIWREESGLEDLLYVC